MKYFICEHCGNIIEYVKDTGVPVMCCGQKMTELIPGTTDGAHEKHVPVVTVKEDLVTVTVGAVEHPMMEEHYIQWIVIETTKGSHRVNLNWPMEKSSLLHMNIVISTDYGNPINKKFPIDIAD